MSVSCRFRYSNQAAINACVALGGGILPFDQYETMFEMATRSPALANSYTVTIPASASKFFAQYLTEPYCAAHYADAYTGTVSVSALVRFLDGIALNYGANAFTLPDSVLSYPGALIGAMMQGQLQLTPHTAGMMIRQCVGTGITPQSWWETFGQPLLYMAAAVVGGEFLGAAGGAAGSSTTGGIAAGTGGGVTGAGSLTLAQPIDLSGLTSVSGAGISAIGSVGVVSAGGTGVTGVLGAIEGGVNTAGDVLKAGTTLAGLSQLGKKPISGPITSGGNALVAPAKTGFSLSTMLLLLGGGAALLFLI